MAYSIKPITYSEVQQQFPDAWDALPSSYQNDSCLSFSVDTDGVLWAEFDLGGVWMFDGVRWVGGPDRSKAH